MTNGRDREFVVVEILTDELVGKICIANSNLLNYYLVTVSRVCMLVR